MKKNMPFISIGFALVLALFLVASIKSASYAADDNQGYVIIQPDSNQRYIREIVFTGTINGLQALELAGAQVVTTTTAYGVAVCAIDGVGCPASDCFCDTAYWGYSTWESGAWQDYMVGPAGSTLSDGAIEGWKWGEWGSAAIPTATHLIAANEALNYLLSIQGADGGYTSASGSVETLLSIASNSIHPADWRKPGNQFSLANTLLLNGAKYSSNNSAAAGKLSVGLTGSQGCLPYASQSPSHDYNPATGIYDVGAGGQSWAILGASALGDSIPAQAITYLKSLQKSDGSFEWGPGYGYDTNSTSMAIQALIAGGESITSTAVISGLNYLQSAQNTDGGFPYDPVSTYGTDSDANSTAYVIQAIIAAGQDPSASPWVQSGGDPFDFLLSLQLADGSIEWQKGLGVNTLATQQAIPALLHRSYPLVTNTLSNCPTSFLPIILSEDAE